MTMKQEALLNLLLRNYLHYNLYDQAEKLRSKAPKFLSRSSQQVWNLLLITSYGSLVGKKKRRNSNLFVFLTVLCPSLAGERQGPFFAGSEHLTTKRKCFVHPIYS
jgi:hypothetical protein